MATRIRFKRGETDVVKSYIDAYVGEPIYDLQKGTLYIKKEDGELFPVSGIANIVDTLPTFNTVEHTGRIIYVNSTNMFYFGTNTKWQHTSPEFCHEHKNVNLSGQTTVNLDFHDDLAMGTVNLTGVLNNNVTITFPQKNQVFTITNNTTGSFVISLKVISKTTNITIKQNSTILVLNDTNKLINISKDYFDNNTNSYSRELLTKSTSTEVRNYLGLGSASILNWGTEVGNLVRLVDDGFGQPTLPSEIINKLDDLIITPEILSPENGDGAVDPSSLTIVGSEFACIYSAYTRDYRVFQIKEESDDWDSTVIEFTDDVDQKEFTTLTPEKIYNIRIKDVDIKGNESEWSNIITVNTSSVYITTPSLTVESSSGNAVLSPLLTGGTFNVVGTSTTHTATDWRIINLTNGTTVWSSLNNTINKTSITVSTQLNTNTNYEFQVRYIDSASNVSAWRSVIMTTISVMITTPVLQVEVNGDDKIFRSDPLLEGNSFSVTPSGFLDIHISTDWRVKTTSNTIIWSSLLDSVNKTSIRIDSNILDEDTDYIFEVRYRGQSYGVSSWRSLTVRTMSSFDQVIPPDYTSLQNPTLENYGGSGWIDSVEDGYYFSNITEEPLNVFYNGTELTKSNDISNLNVGEWGFGNADGLANDVLYVRLLDDNNPNTEDIEDVQIEPKYAITITDIGGQTYVNSTAPGYYLNTSTSEPVNLYYNGTQLVRGSTLSNLQENQWGFGDLDSIGGNRIYVRLPGNINPSTVDTDNLQYSTKKYWDILFLTGAQFGFLGYKHNHYGTKIEVYDLDGVKLYEKEQFNEFNPSDYTFTDQIPAQSSDTTLVTVSDNQLYAFRLFDKNDIQFWQIPGNTGWAKYEFDTVRRPYLGRYSLTIRDSVSSPTQAPKDFKLQGSVSGSDWIDLDVQTGITNWTSGQTKTFNITPVSGTGYRYYRLLITDNNGHTTTELSEIRLFTHTQENSNELIGIDDFSDLNPNTTYKVRVGYNTNVQGFTDYSFGSFISVTTGDTLIPLINKPFNIYPEHLETGVSLSPELETSDFDSEISDVLNQVEYIIQKTSDSTISYNYILTLGIINKPINIFPSNGSTNITNVPELESSDFSYSFGDGDTLDEREYIIQKTSDNTILYNVTI